LKQFLMQVEIRGLYRSMIRLANKCEEPQRSELRDYIRHEFDVKVIDYQHGRMLLSQGKRSAEQLRLMVAKVG
jgi:hypothetical protein